MELSKQDLQVVGDLLGVQVETIMDWYRNEDSLGEFERDFNSYNRVLDKIEKELGVESLWDTSLYKEGRKYYRDHIKKYRLFDKGVVTDNRDSSETWVWVGDTRFVVTRIDMENVVKMGWGRDESQFLEVNGVTLELFAGDYEYLLDNLKNNNPEE